MNPITISMVIAAAAFLTVSGVVQLLSTVVADAGSYVNALGGVRI